MISKKPLFRHFRMLALLIGVLGILISGCQPTKPKRSSTTLPPAPGTHGSFRSLIVSPGRPSTVP